ncbi:MAG TPA: DUF6600 domain-containing protein [Methylomirabilota bacterium]|nr:DUF6600 domain-containing protein [Methylomirabilota bacterium]
MTGKHVTIAAIAVTVALAAAPAAANDWFGVSISNHGLSVGFGASNWGLWASSWDRDPWVGGWDTALGGYGEWVWVDGLGRVWRPWVAASWRPFSHGRWVWTSLGWTWVAYEPWGWLPHHYGNWAMTTVGWVWTPGYDYHPGNVLWVSSGSHVGWVPCAPRGWSHAHRAFNHGWSNGYRHGVHDGYRSGYADGWRDARYATWVSWTHLGADSVAHHAVGYDVATRAVARASVTSLAAPPSKHEVERRGGRAVPEARITERTATVDGRQLKVVRPEGQEVHVRRHAGETVERALAPSARSRVSAPDEGGRSVTGPGTSTAGSRGAQSPHAEPGRMDRSVPSSAEGVGRRSEAIRSDRGAPTSPARPPRPAAAPPKSTDGSRAGDPRGDRFVRPESPRFSTGPSSTAPAPARAPEPRVDTSQRSRSRVIEAPARTQRAPASAAPASRGRSQAPAVTTAPSSRAPSVESRPATRRIPTTAGRSAPAPPTKEVTTSQRSGRPPEPSPSARSRDRSKSREQPERSSGQQQRRSRSRG